MGVETLPPRSPKRWLAPLEQNSMRSWLVTIPPIKWGAPPVGSAQDGFDKGWGVFP
jgi:hypothetical protein